MQCKNLEIVKKTGKIYEIPFKKNGAVVDITDWTVYFTAKVSMKDSDANAKIAKKITTHEDATNGITLIELSESDTDIEVGNYYYGIDYKDSSGKIGTVLFGRLKIIKPVRATKD